MEFIKKNAAGLLPCDSGPLLAFGKSVPDYRRSGFRHTCRNGADSYY